MATKYKIIGHSIVFSAVLLLSLSFLIVRPTPAAAACNPGGTGDAACKSAAECTAAGGTPTFKKNSVDNGQDFASCNAAGEQKDTGDNGGIGEASSDPAVNGSKNGHNCSNVNNCDLVTKYINPFVNLLAALVGVAITISIVIGAIQYGSSAGDPQAVNAAKERIRNSIVALLTFIFLYALLNFLIPGGLL